MCPEAGEHVRRRMASGGVERTAGGRRPSSHLRTCTTRIGVRRATAGTVRAPRRGRGAVGKAGTGGPSTLTRTGGARPLAARPKARCAVHMLNLFNLNKLGITGLKNRFEVGVQ